MITDQRLNEEVERRVAERTEKLLRINEELRQMVCERQESAQAQQKSQRQYEALVQSIDGIVWELDVESFRFLFVSEQAERVLGYPVEEWLAEPNFCAAHLHPDDSAWVLDFCLTATERRQDHQLEFRMIGADGRVVWLRDMVTVCVLDDQTVRLRGVMVDITESKRAQEALQKSAAEIHELYNQAPCGYHSLNEEGVYIAINETELRWFGLRREEVIGRLRLLDLLTAESQERFRADFLKFKEQGEVHDLEYQMISRDGTIKSVLLSAVAVRDQAGNFQMSCATLYDITERKKAEDQVSLLQTITLEMAAVSDLTSALQVVLRCVCEKTGWVFGQVWIPNSDKTALDCGPTWMADAGLAKFRADSEGFKFLPGEGLPGRVWTSKQPVWVEDVTADSDFPRAKFAEKSGLKAAFALPILIEGEVIAIIEFFLRQARREDSQLVQLITAVAAQLGMAIEHKRAEVALRESENRWRTLFNDALLGIALADEQGRLVQTNPALQKMLGYTKEELQGRFFKEVTHPDDVEMDVTFYFELLGGKRNHYQMEKRYLKKDGQEVWGNLIVSLLGNERAEGPLAVGMVEDITERKRAEAELKATSDQLRALTASLSLAREEEGRRIAREIHDELGSALTSLQWDLESLHKKFSEPEAQLSKNRLGHKLEAMIALTHTTIQTVRKIASELRPSVLDDLGLAEAIEWQAQQFQERTGIRCHCDCSLENLTLNQEQSTAVFRIFQEALTNVLRHSQATSVEVLAKQEADQFILTVGDNGVGITQEQKAGPRALGLLGMQERANLIKGEIQITGVAGEGTVVTVRVPLS